MAVNNISEPSLCDSCEKWPLQEWLFPRHADDLRFEANLRELDEVRSNISCAFCRLLLQCLELNNSIQNITSQKSAWVYWAPHVFGTKYDSPGLDQGVIVTRIYVSLLVDGESFTTERDGTVYGNCIQTCAPEDQGEGGRLLRGRMVNTTCVDPGLMSTWLQNCRDYHGEECAPATFSVDCIDPKITLRVIDIGNRCIIDAPSRCQFVALSYVWGSANQLKLEKKNYARLRSAGGLSDDLADIPETIKDAMYLCEKLGERYLWVDALCIKQDDNDDKLDQIRSMDHIFSCAVLTIVAAGGDSANAIIPGVREHSREIRQQHSAVVKGVKLMIAQRPFLSSVAESRWNSRGWTFQEKALSKRLLFFTPYQAFYQCNQGISFEDAYIETTNTNFKTDINQSEGLVNRMYLSKPSREMSSFKKYSTYVEGYALRNLSRQEDILHAFAGILNILRREFSSEFYWGLPESTFDTALSWNVSNHFPERRRKGFPSWSWVGWQVESNSGLSAYGKMAIKCIQWYRPGGNGEMVLINARVGEEGSDHDSSKIELLPGTGHESSHVPPLEPAILRSPHLPQILRAWSSVTRLHVDMEGVETERRHGNERLTIRTSAGKELGVFYLNKDWRQSRPEILDFMVICRYRAPEENIGKMGSWQTGLVVILVEFEDGGLAQKVQRVPGPIEENLWFESNPQWKLVTLV